MPIQFRCRACGQPIEVDDEAAQEMVCCPFCKELSQAPAESDTTIHLQRADASLQIPAARPGAGAPDSASRGKRASGNRLGWLALAMVGVALICVVVLTVVSASIVLGHGPFEDMAQMQKELEREVEARPWMNALGLLGSCAAPLIGLGCAITALARRATPRWPAILALCLSGMMVLMMFIGSLMSRYLQGS